jgi:hypothetical protein
MIKRCNIGCGTVYKEGWINVDISNNDIYGNKIKVDRIQDLNIYPWKCFKNNEFDEIECSGIIEHLQDRVRPWKELKRIIKNGCIIHVRGVPHYSGYSGYDDISHYQRYTYRTGEMIAEMFGFELLSNKIIYSANPFLRWMNPIVNLYPRFYERFLCNIIPSIVLEWDFKVKK